MYSHHTNGLGEAAPAAPTLWDSFSNLLQTGVTSGFNIYNKVTNLKQQQVAATTAQAQAQQMSAYNLAMLQQQQQQPPQSDFLSGWTIPLLVAGVAVVGVILLKRK